MNDPGLKIYYHNDLNNALFHDFTSEEMNLFYSICGRLKHHKKDKVILDFFDLRNYSGRKRQSDNDMFEFLDKFSEKIVSVNMLIAKQNKSRSIRFPIFSILDINKDNKTLTVQLNPNFDYLMNNLKGNFTTFTLSEYMELHNKYAKRLFPLLKQYNGTGFVILPIFKLRLLLEIPDSYKNSHIVERVIKPATSELSLLFSNLNVARIYGGRNARKNELTGFKFTFDKGIKPKEMTKELQDDIEEWINKNS